MLTRDDVRKELLSLPYGPTVESINQVMAKELEGDGRFGNTDLMRLKKILGRSYREDDSRAKRRRNSVTADDEESPIAVVPQTGEPTYDQAPSVALLTERIRPWVESLRTAIFGDPSPPFEDVESCRKWQGPAQSDRRLMSENEGKKIVAMEAELERRAHQLEKLTGDWIDLKRTPVKLSWWSHDLKKYVWLAVKPGTPYWLLASEVMEMVDLTGFDRTSLTEHVLTGGRLNLQSIQISRHRREGREGITNTHLCLRLNMPVSDKGMRAVYRQIREQWPEAFSLSADQRLLVEIVRTTILKEPPGCEQVDWECVKAEWERRGMPPKHWRAFMEQHQRIKSKDKKERQNQRRPAEEHLPSLWVRGGSKFGESSNTPEPLEPGTLSS